ncbi:hypothetical protein ABE424_03620 [Stenotrophomonas sp. TWI1149]|uniref:hypothetical protein n=1 Tax=unclassified Stenotrophomonas TaxID=196198 RepID=UPI003209F965
MSPEPSNLDMVRSDAPPTEGEVAELREAVDRMRRNRSLLDGFNRKPTRFVRDGYLVYVGVCFTRDQPLKLVSAKLAPVGK